MDKTIDFDFTFPTHSPFAACHLTQPPHLTQPSLGVARVDSCRVEQPTRFNHPAVRRYIAKNESPNTCMMHACLLRLVPLLLAHSSAIRFRSWRFNAHCCNQPHRTPLFQVHVSIQMPQRSNLIQRACLAAFKAFFGFMLIPQVLGTSDEAHLQRVAADLCVIVTFGV